MKLIFTLVFAAMVRSGHGPSVVNQWGWGEKLADFVDSGKANLVNLASGNSNRNFLDLQEIVARQYERRGPAAIDPLFADPHTHTSLAGAPGLETI